MNKIIYFFICLFLVSSVNGQRVNIDKLTFKVNSRRLPNKILAPEYKTYSVQISATAALEAYTNQSYSDQVNIVGLKKVQGKGHLNIKVDLDDLIIESSEVQKREEIRKDKSGKETGRTAYYSVQVIYTFAAIADVKDYKNYASMERYSLARRDGSFNRNEFKSAEYGTYKEAADYYNNNRLELKTRFVRERIEAALSALNSNLNKDFGYPLYWENVHIWYAGTKKHIEHDNSLNAGNAIQTALSKLTPEDSIKGVKESITDAIAYFEKLPTIYNEPEEKEHKKLRYCAYYNLGIIYYHLEQPELAMTYAQKLIDNDYDAGDGKDLIKDCQALIESLKKHNVTTRHFPIDITNFEAPQ
jgi:tetratricopeptide (TPR) repeat protein